MRMMILVWTSLGWSVVPIDAVYYDFLLALDRNLTSIFNRSWDITPCLHIYTPPLSQVELEKDGWV